MPAERTSFGALADITVTTSYRAPSLVDAVFSMCWELNTVTKVDIIRVKGKP
jgi:hypothetical protein